MSLETRSCSPSLLPGPPRDTLSTGLLLCFSFLCPSSYGSQLISFFHSVPVQNLFILCGAVLLILSSFSGFLNQVLWLQSSTAFKAFTLPLSCSEVCAFSVPNQMLSSFLVLAPHSSFYTDRAGLQRYFVEVYLWLAVLFVLLKTTVQMFWLEAPQRSTECVTGCALAPLMLLHMLCASLLTPLCAALPSSLSGLALIPVTVFSRFRATQQETLSACVVELWTGCSSTFYLASINWNMNNSAQYTVCTPNSC